MSKFAESAKKSLKSSRVMEGRTKLKTDKVIEDYPNGVTVDEFDMLHNSKGEEYVVMHIKDTDFYFNGGALALQIAQGWVDDYDGDAIKASDDLKQDGGVTFILGKKPTKNGNTITTYTIVD